MATAVQDKLDLVPPGVPGSYRVVLYPMGDDPAWDRQLLYMAACCWASAEQWKCMPGRMYSGGQVGLVEICFVEEGQEQRGPVVVWSGRATDVPRQ